VDPFFNDQPWSQRALCRGEDPELFFAPDGYNEDAKRKYEAEAKAICRGCPVANDCLNFALEHGRVHGVWGGLGEDERMPLHRATPLSH
jgi:WhiB family redox-sensing transcriptional regulator